ncbi:MULTISPECIES: NmrA family NAD(P)-binding protein [unclassified Flavobacterium]|uniref:NmrA family NAD(P)-binding protein n=1 Tax=unclassified Flavobacterium TaxID=196869 RepID=UPI001F145C76|nr:MULTISPECIES: NmrA family NAD(P)-binding protein [unclassified Flavobacterium]UMY64563.1 NAD(P)H-binding protein [Flavobacterium sp. HJ-32-4]
MIVITGATGKIGSQVASQLAAMGHKVRIMGRDAGSLARLTTVNIESVEGNMNDITFLTNAFKGATAALLMLPPSREAADFGAFQDEVGLAQVGAVKNAGIKHIVFLSSQGAHDIEHTGTVKGLGRQEARLNALPPEVNVISLRPEAFMENSIDSLRLFQTIASPLRPDVRTGQIATRDIANFAAQRLSKLDFTGKTHQDLLGDREYSQSEIARIAGRAIGRPLEYLQLSYADYQQKLIEAGMSENRAAMITERYKAINDGRFNSGVRDAVSTTPTSFEEFAREVLQPMFAVK